MSPFSVFPARLILLSGPPVSSHCWPPCPQWPGRWRRQWQCSPPPEIPPQPITRTIISIYSDRINKWYIISIISIQTWENINCRTRLAIVLMRFSSLDRSEVTVEQVLLRSEGNLSFLEFFCFDFKILSPPYSEDITFLFCLYIWSFILKSRSKICVLPLRVMCTVVTSEARFIFLKWCLWTVCMFFFSSQPNWLHPDIFSQHKTYGAIFPSRGI